MQKPEEFEIDEVNVAAMQFYNTMLDKAATWVRSAVPDIRDIQLRDEHMLRLAFVQLNADGLERSWRLLGAALNAARFAKRVAMGIGGGGNEYEEACTAVDDIQFMMDTLHIVSVQMRAQTYHTSG
jgi:hypothetical protein